MSEVSEVARRLKELREQAGLTMRSVSDALGWSLTRYQHYEDRYKRKYLPFELARARGYVRAPGRRRRRGAAARGTGGQPEPADAAGRRRDAAGLAQRRRQPARPAGAERIPRRRR